MRPYALIAALLFSLSPAISMAAESEEYIDEQWTLSRIEKCPEDDKREAMLDDGISVKPCAEHSDTDGQFHSAPPVTLYSLFDNL